MNIKKFESFVNNKMNIPEDIYNFYKLFKKTNKDLFIVGGAVRDFIMGIEPHDFDLVTNASPDQVIEILKNFRTDLQGKHFGVIRVFTKDCKEGYEIATYRKDISSGRDTKGLDKKVELDNISLEDDLQRRDISINALIYDIENNKIVDLVNGVNDINNKIISTVGDANNRFAEDRLRILRAIRFSARYNFNLDEKTQKAIIKDNRLSGISNIDDVSQERIIEEIYKMWEYAIKRKDNMLLFNYFNLLIKYDLMKYIFLDLNINVNNIYSLNLAVLFSNFLKNNNNNNLLNVLIQKIKLNSKISNEIVFLLKLQTLNFDNFYELKKLQNKIEIDKRIIYEFFYKTNQYEKIIEKFLKFKLTITGQELIDKGYTGREIGIEMKRLEDKNFIDFMYDTQ